MPSAESVVLERAAAPGAQTPAVAQWHVLWTRSNCEQSVYDQLSARGLRVFLPKLAMWSRRGGVRHVITVPMFRGYVFMRHAMDKASYIEVAKTTGLVRLLGERWDRLAAVPDDEIAAIQQVVRAEVRTQPHPYLRAGQRVRITRGPLADVEGILIRTKPNKGLLVVSIHMLHRSVAVEVDCTAAVPA